MAWRPASTMLVAATVFLILGAGVTLHMFLWNLAGNGFVVFYGERYAWVNQAAAALALAVLGVRPYRHARRRSVDSPLGMGPVAMGALTLAVFAWAEAALVLVTLAPGAPEPNAPLSLALVVAVTLGGVAAHGRFTRPLPRPPLAPRATKANDQLHGRPSAGRQRAPSSIDVVGPLPPFLEFVRNPGVTFAAVIGMDEAKRDLRESFDLIQSPDVRALHRIEPIRGIILRGPPGTGKTYFARAVAGEFGQSFLHVNTAQLVSKWEGETEKNIETCFEVARRLAPGILFFDELDTIALDRERAQNSWETSRVNQLLKELDGIQQSDQAPIVLAATNAFDRLDPAVVRPGRLGRHIYVGPPALKERRDLLRHFLRDRPIDATLDLSATARLTEGWTQAEIKQLCDNVARAIYREDPRRPPRPVRNGDLQRAFDELAKKAPAMS